MVHSKRQLSPESLPGASSLVVLQRISGAARIASNESVTEGQGLPQLKVLPSLSRVFVRFWLSGFV